MTTATKLFTPIMQNSIKERAMGCFKVRTLPINLHRHQSESHLHSPFNVATMESQHMSLSAHLGWSSNHLLLVLLVNRIKSTHPTYQRPNASSPHHIHPLASNIMNNNILSLLTKRTSSWILWPKAMAETLADQPQVILKQSRQCPEKGLLAISIKSTQRQKSCQANYENA